MKLGNVSQSIVPIPKFFSDKATRTIELFKQDNNFSKTKYQNKRKTSYFRSNDLFRSNCDLNLNHNPRTFTNEKENYDEQKYIPLYDRTFYSNNAEIKETYFPNIIDTFKVKPLDVPSNKNEYKNVFKFLKNTNMNFFLKKDLRDEIMNNTKNLIERISTTYDLNKWNEFDSRTTMNKEFQTAYSPLTDVINNSPNNKEEFIKTLHKKSLSLKTITEKSKLVLRKNIKNNKFFPERKKFAHISSMTKNRSELDILLDNNKSKLLGLKNNNNEPIEYSKENKEFIEQNKSITSNINKFKLYKYFPSMTRMEFVLKKVFPNKKKNSSINDWGVIDINKYKSKKEVFSCLDPMWKRPLHLDAYKIIK